MSAPEIRPAKKEDIDPLADILSNWIDETDWMPRIHTREQDRAFVADIIHAGGVRVVSIDDSHAGFVFEEGGHIGALYLAPVARGQGVGKVVLDDLKDEHPKLDLWTFEANKAARRFYSREGFVQVERTDGDNEERLPDVRMVWKKEAGND